MARTQAADYDQRRAAIVEAAAELWAEKGFLGASVADLAKACNTSKSLIYHYYPSTRDILFEAMDSHVRELRDVAQSVMAEPLTPRAKLEKLNRIFVGLYSHAAARQTVLLNELDQLDPGQRAAIVTTQRELLALVEALLAEVRPDLPASRLHRAVTMLFFGMINWLHTWYDADGAAPPDEIADLATSMLLDGLERAKI